MERPRRWTAGAASSPAPRRAGATYRRRNANSPTADPAEGAKLASEVLQAVATEREGSSV